MAFPLGFLHPLLSFLQEVKEGVGDTWWCKGISDIKLRPLYLLCHLTISADQLRVLDREFCKHGAILPLSSIQGQKSIECRPLLQEHHELI